MDFVRKDFDESLAGFIGGVAHSEALNTFEVSLRSMVESASKDSSEEFQKNLIAEFLRKSFGYECNVRGKADLAIYDEGKAKVLFEVKSTQNKAEFVKMPSLSSLKGKSTRSNLSLREQAEAIYYSCHTERSEVSKHKNSNMQIPLDSSLPAEAQNDKVIDCHEKSSDFSRNDKNARHAANQNLNSKIFDEIVPQRETASEAHLGVRRNEADLRRGAISQKAEFSLESKAFYESILYFLREFHAHKNNNLKHIILCTAREFYVIRAQEYHALFVKNADKAIQSRIDSAYKNCDLRQGNDTSTGKFYEQIAQIVRDMGDRLEFTYINVPAILGDNLGNGLGENLGDNEREREREKKTARAFK